MTINTIADDNADNDNDYDDKLVADLQKVLQMLKEKLCPDPIGLSGVPLPMIAISDQYIDNQKRLSRFQFDQVQQIIHEAQKRIKPGYATVSEPLHNQWTQSGEQREKDMLNTISFHRERPKNR